MVYEVMVLWPRTIPPSRVALPVAMKLLHETFGSSGERAPIESFTSGHQYPDSSVMPL